MVLALADLRAPGQSVCNFLRGTLKSKVYCNSPLSLQELHQSISYDFAAISGVHVTQLTDQGPKAPRNEWLWSAISTFRELHPFLCHISL
ncbi:hypothetical protein TNCV_4312801 [Trichonephila clavipes]|nr:hypothetical protein TNCV_4312801 [Trichonephila clavipes]